MGFHQDIDSMISSSRDAGEEGRWVENWTKWRLFLGEGEEDVVYSQQRKSLDNMSFPMKAVFEWRTDYTAEIDEIDGELVVSTEQPWASSLGLYHHYTVRVDGGNKVTFLPHFMFGFPQSVLDKLYGGPDHIHTIGMM